MNNQIIFGKFLGLYNFVRWLFIILDLLLLLGFIFSFYKAWQFRPKLNHKKTKKKTISLQREVYRAKWFDITLKFKEGDLNSQKLAIIEADKLVNSILEEIGVPGKHLADKLSKINPESLKSLEGLFMAHRKRNDLMRIPGFVLPEEETKKILGHYESFLKEVGVIIE